MALKINAREIWGKCSYSGAEHVVAPCKWLVHEGSVNVRLAMQAGSPGRHLGDALRQKIHISIRHTQLADQIWVLVWASGVSSSRFEHNEIREERGDVKKKIDPQVPHENVTLWGSPTPARPDD